MRIEAMNIRILCTKITKIGSKSFIIEENLAGIFETHGTIKKLKGSAKEPNISIYFTFSAHHSMVIGKGKVKV